MSATERKRRLVLTLRNLTDHLVLHTPTSEIVVTARILNGRIRVGIEATDEVVVTRHTGRKNDGSV